MWRRPHRPRARAHRRTCLRRSGGRRRGSGFTRDDCSIATVPSGWPSNGGRADLSLCRCSAAGGCAAKTKPRWRIGHVQTVHRSRGRGAAVHHAGRNSGASGSRQRGSGADATEAACTAGCCASTARNSTRRSARALDGPGCSTACDRRANPSTRRSSGCAASRRNSDDAASRRNAAIKRGGRHHTSQAEKEEAPLRALRLLRLPALPREAVLSLAPAFLVAVQTAALSLRPPAAARVLLPAPLALTAELIPAARLSGSNKSRAEALLRWERQREG